MNKDYVVDESGFNKELSEFKSLIGAIEPSFLDEVGKVLAHGAKKYGRDNWKLAEGGKEQLYIDALHRHINAFQQGQYTDKETDLHHLAHAACNLMFLYYFSKTKLRDTNIKDLEDGGYINSKCLERHKAKDSKFRDWSRSNIGW